MLLIFGCGYVGERVARRRVGLGMPVATVTRSQARAAELQALGIDAHVGDIMEPHTLPEEALVANEVLFAVGYDRSSAFSITEVYEQGLRNVLQRLPTSSTRRFVYLSSTGVYGDHQGDWVDEQTPCRPQREGGRACLAAEQELTRHPAVRDEHLILRLAGIYGPGRVPRLQAMRDGRPMPAPPNTWLNLIHVDDIVTSIESAFQADGPPPNAGNAGRVCCVSDGRPVRRLDYYQTLAELAGAPAPQWTESDDPNASHPRAAADKRIRNDRLLQLLDSCGLRLQHPDYRSGLSAILQDGD